MEAPGDPPTSSRWARFLRKPWHDKWNVLHDWIFRLKGSLYYRRVFAAFGRGSVLFKPVLLSNPRFMRIGNHVIIRQGARLEAIINNPRRTPALTVGDNVNIEQNVHIVCQSRIRIGNNVSITGNTAIVDTTHPYRDIAATGKIGETILDEDSFVEIDDHAFVGYGSVILPNVRIGKRCMIGAHSCVTRSVPDYCVVSGNPARIVARYDAKAARWVQLTPDSG